MFNRFNGHDSGTDRLEVPTRFEASIAGLWKGISPKNTALCGAEPPLLDPEIPIDIEIY